jgi:hypothetical protein
MRMPAVSLAILLLSIGPATAGSDFRDAVQQTLLVAVAPGGTRAVQPIIDPQAAHELIPTVVTSIPRPTTPAVDTHGYYAQLASLLGMPLAALVYELDAPGESLAGQQPVFEISAGEDGRLWIPAGSLKPEAAYAWQLSGRPTHGSETFTITSAPVYFRTAPCPELCPEIAGAETAELVAILSRWRAVLTRRKAALSCILAGRQPYQNYPQASDHFICKPLTRDGRPPLLPGQTLDPYLLRQLAGLMDACLYFAATGTESAADQLAEQLADVRAGVAGLLEERHADDASGLEAHAAVLLDLLANCHPQHDGFNRLLSGDNPELLASLLVATEQLANATSGAATVDYDAAFIEFADLLAAELLATVELAPRLEALAGEDDAWRWIHTCLDQHALLVELRADVSRQRYSKAQLADQLTENATALSWEPGIEFHYVAPVSLAVDARKAGHIHPGEDLQISRLRREITLAHLGALLKQIWLVSGE